MNAFSPALFSAGAPCLPCCVPPPAGCLCALPVGFDFVGYLQNLIFPDYSSAFTAMTAGYASCWSFEQNVGDNPGTGPIPSIMTADVSVANQVTLNCTAVQQNTVLYVSINIKSGSTVSIAYTAMGGTFTGGNAYLISCDYDGIHGTLQFRSVMTQPGTITFSPVILGGEYIIQCEMDIDAGTETVALVISADDTNTVNPVIALWDDSGTTRQLWACPKNIIPRSGLIGTIGDWFASQSDAQDAIDNFTSNCVGYFNSAFSVDSFSAVDGGTSLAFSTSSGGGGSLGAYGGVNAVAGQTLSMAFTGSVGTVTCFFAVLDYNGALLYSNGFGSTSSPVVSSALPYTGQYFMTVIVGTDAGAVPFDATATLTSSGAMSVNPIKAVYDIGLNCPAALDCA